jgi:hypothetical protein
VRISRKDFLRWLPALGYALAARSLFARDQAAPRKRPIHISEGKLRIEGADLQFSFSLHTDAFRFMYFYIPDRGLLTISHAPFTDAQQAGEFIAEKMSFDIPGISGSIESSTPMFDEERVPVFARWDSAYRLNVDSVMFGYGDSDRAPYDWPSQIHSGR